MKTELVGFSDNQVFCRNRSDNVLTNSKALGRRPVVNISDKLDAQIIYMGINLLLNSINRGLSIRHHRNKGRFYSVNSHTVINSITPSQVTPQKDN